ALKDEIASVKKGEGMASSRFQAIDLARVIGILLVMLGHSTLTSVDAKETLPYYLIITYLGYGGVLPLFFMLSGYFAAYKIDDDRVSVFSYYANRVKALVIPFLFWNALVLAIVFAVKAVASPMLRGHGFFFDVQPTFVSAIDALLGIGRLPIVYQLWFVRDLIIVSFVALPFCRVMPKSPVWPFLFMLVPIDQVQWLGCFLLGYYAMRLPSFNYNIKNVGVALVLWACLGVALFFQLVSLYQPMFMIVNALAMLGFSFLLSSLRISKAATSLLAPAVFFLYCIHEPTETLVARIWAGLHLPYYGSLFCWFVIPWGIVLPIAMVAFKMMSRYTPRLLTVMTGGR
ncbi:MAG: acyltransferase, partial [Smithellaceae bacterium]|nr:acyltransferase [Smithellaceae bacterium]